MLEPVGGYLAVVYRGGGGAQGTGAPPSALAQDPAQ